KSPKVQAFWPSFGHIKKKDLAVKTYRMKIEVYSFSICFPTYFRNHFVFRCKTTPIIDSAKQKYLQQRSVFALLCSVLFPTCAGRAYQPANSRILIDFWC